MTAWLRPRGKFVPPSPGEWLGLPSERWSPILGQVGGLVKVEGIFFHAAASVVHVLGDPQYASSGVLPSRLE